MTRLGCRSPTVIAAAPPGRRPAAVSNGLPFNKVWSSSREPRTGSDHGTPYVPVSGHGRIAVPMVADLLALRRVPAGFFGVFMSVNPVFAALTGLVVLGQSLGLAG